MTYLISYNAQIEMREVDTMELINGEENYNLLTKADTLKQVTDFLLQWNKNK